MATEGEEDGAADGGVDDEDVGGGGGGGPEVAVAGGGGGPEAREDRVAVGGVGVGDEDAREGDERVAVAPGLRETAVHERGGVGGVEEHGVLEGGRAEAHRRSVIFVWAGVAGGVRRQRPEGVEGGMMTRGGRRRQSVDGAGVVAGAEALEPGEAGCAKAGAAAARRDGVHGESVGEAAQFRKRFDGLVRQRGVDGGARLQAAEAPRGVAGVGREANLDELGVAAAALRDAKGELCVNAPFLEPRRGLGRAQRRVRRQVRVRRS
mmetsp:Transcript_19450/g.60053  ORF Transcript_19450/g.60053 Transcript_19450/m.60053 type:complete len:264 (+) Transcript_19450:127-918(+)